MTSKPTNTIGWIAGVWMVWLLATSLTGCGGGDDGGGASPAGSAGATPSAVARSDAPARAAIEVLSNRADLVSGGEALVEVTAPAGVDPRILFISLNGVHDVRAAFAMSGEGRYLGLVGGMTPGRNTLSVEGPSVPRSTIEIVNHRAGGPLFAGPQVQPWTCQPGAIDADCNQPPSFSWVYRSSDPAKPGFQPYDPLAPARDVAEVTTDRGVTVPFVVRVETGHLARNQYQIATLYQPGMPWSAAAPQAQFNHKLLITHGALCGTSFRASRAPSVLPGLPGGIVALIRMVGIEAGVGGEQDPAYLALASGYAVMSTAQANSGVDCNVANQAESLVIARQHLIDHYGLLRYTIGYGCSGGSLAEQSVQNAYPGIYQALVATCSFPDAWSTATQVADHAALLQYFERDRPQRPVWTALQRAAIAGGVRRDPQADASAGSAVAARSAASIDVSTLANLLVYRQAYFPAIDPANPACEIADKARLYGEHNPAGARCSIADLNLNLFGPRAQPVWSRNEAAVGHGFAAAPYDNVGVQYGWWALQNSLIDAERFIDLNRYVGGIDVDGKPAPGRTVASELAVSRAYRSGAINVANHLADTPIVDCVGPNGAGGALDADLGKLAADAAPLASKVSGLLAPALAGAARLVSEDPAVLTGANLGAHDTFRAFAMRARLDRRFGAHDNHTIWEGPAPLVADRACVGTAFRMLDQWLGAVEADRGTEPLARKLAAHRPAQAADGCWNGKGTFVAGKLCAGDVAPVFQTPRMIAGDDIATLANKCRLKPLDRGDYPAGQFTDAQWYELNLVFPQGVCDYAQAPVGETDAVAWLRYQEADGSVVYGGVPMSPAPPRSGRGWASPVFRPFAM